MNGYFILAVLVPALLYAAYIVGKWKQLEEIRREWRKIEAHRILARQAHWGRNGKKKKTNFIR